MRVWDLSKQSCTALLKGHLSYVTSLAFFAGGSGIVSGGRDRVLNVWDLERLVEFHGSFVLLECLNFFYSCENGAFFYFFYAPVWIAHDIFGSYLGRDTN